MAGLLMEEGRSGRVSRLSYIKPRPTPQLVRARKLRMVSLSVISDGDMNLRSVAKCNRFLRYLNGCLWHDISCGAGALAVPHLPRSTKGTEKKNANASMPQGEPQQLRPRCKRRCGFPLGERTLRKWLRLFEVDSPSCAYEGWMERELCHQPWALRGTEQDISLENQRDFTWHLLSISELFATRSSLFHNTAVGTSRLGISVCWSYAVVHTVASYTPHGVRHSKTATMDVVPNRAMRFRPCCLTLTVDHECRKMHRATQ